MAAPLRVAWAMPFFLTVAVAVTGLIFPRLLAIILVQLRIDLGGEEISQISDNRRTGISKWYGEITPRIIVIDRVPEGGVVGSLLRGGGLSLSQSGLRTHLLALGIDIPRDGAADDGENQKENRIFHKNLFFPLSGGGGNELIISPPSGNNDNNPSDNFLHIFFL